MNYLTNYYKNLSEQLQYRVNVLQTKLNEAAAPVTPPPHRFGDIQPLYTPGELPPSWGGNLNIPNRYSDYDVYNPTDPGTFFWDANGDGEHDGVPPETMPLPRKGETYEQYQQRLQQWRAWRDAWNDYVKWSTHYWAYMRNRQPNPMTSQQFMEWLQNWLNQNGWGPDTQDWLINFLTQQGWL